MRAKTSNKRLPIIQGTMKITIWISEDTEIRLTMKETFKAIIIKLSQQGIKIYLETNGENIIKIQVIKESQMEIIEMKNNWN